MNNFKVYISNNEESVLILDRDFCHGCADCIKTTVDGIIREINQFDGYHYNSYRELIKQTDFSAVVADLQELLGKDGCIDYKFKMGEFVLHIISTSV